MPTTEFCVYNQTRASFLTARVTVISEPLKAVKALIEGLAPDADAGLWLNPLKSIPTVPRLSAYDLVYLDHEGRVVQGAELVPDDEAPRFDGAVSALVLPARTFAASQTVPGDRVIFHPAEEPSPESWVAAPEGPSIPVLKFPGVEQRVTAPNEIEIPPAPSVGPLSVVTAIRQLQPLVWPPAQDPQPSFSAIEPHLIGPQKPSSRFDFLRSIVHLRIRVQISISTAPPVEPNVAPTPLSVSAPATAAVAAHPFRLGFSRAAIRSRAEATAQSCSTLWAAFAHRISLFATATAPLFFRHTVPAGAAQVRRAASTSYTAAKTRYLRWAEAFMFRPADASSVPRIFHLHPARRDRR